MRKSRKQKTIDAKRRRYWARIINKVSKRLADDIDEKLLWRLYDKK